MATSATNSPKSIIRTITNANTSAIFLKRPPFFEVIP